MTNIGNGGDAQLNQNADHNIRIVEYYDEPWSDNEFISACEHLDNLPFYSTGDAFDVFNNTYPKVEFIYKYNVGEGLFAPDVRIINSVEYSFGLTLTNYMEARYTGYYFIKERMQLLYPALLNDLIRRIEKGKDKIEKEAVISQEMDDIKMKVDVAKNSKDRDFAKALYYNGYSCERKQHSWEFITNPPDAEIEDFLATGGFNKEYCKHIIAGQSDAKLELELSRRFHDLKKDVQGPTRLSTIFNNDAYAVCVGMLDDLEITTNGTPTITPGRGGKLFGAIVAITETAGMLKADKMSRAKLLKYFNEHLGTDFLSVETRSDGYQSSYDDAKRYIKLNLKK